MDEKPKAIKYIGIRETTKHMQWLFTILGMWFMISSNSTFRQNISAIILLIFWQIVQLFVIVPAIYYALWQERDVKMQMALAGPVGVAVSSLLKYYAALYQRKNIKKCLNVMRMNWEAINNETDRKIMMVNTEKGTNITLICAVFMYVGGITHQIFAPFLTGSIISIIQNSSDTRPLIYPVYHVLFDSQATPIYEIIYCSHILMGVIICTISVGACNLGAVFITHLYGQLEMIISKLDTLLADQDSEDNDSVNEKMKTILKLHNGAISFSKNVEEVLFEICLIETIASTISICLDEYYCIVALKHNEIMGLILYSVILVSFCFNIFIFCYIGELLKEQYIKAGVAVYNVNWYQLSRKNSHALLFIIAMTQNPRKISAGGLLELSYNGFTSIIKTSMASLNLLRMIEF